MKTTLTFAAAAFLSLAAGPAMSQTSAKKDGRYLCYVVDTISTSAQIKPTEARDQFGRGKLTILKPRYICNPVGLDGTEPADPRTHIVCYEAKADIKPKGPLLIRNEFERKQPAQLTVKEAQLVCIVSAKQIKK